MTDGPIKTVDELERLLRMRAQQNPDDVDHKWEESLIEHFQKGSEPGAPEVPSPLQQTPDMETELALLRQFEADGTISPLDSGPSPEITEVSNSTKSRKHIRIGLTALAASVLVGMGIWLASSYFKMSPSDHGDFRIKGDNDALHVGVQRNNTRFVLQNMDPIKTGDHLGLFYSAEENGYLAVYNVDSNQSATCLFPLSGDQSAPISPGEQRPLDSGAVVTNGEGCEWIVAIFSTKPISLEHLKRKMETAPLTQSPNKCMIKVSIPESRSIQTISVVR